MGLEIELKSASTISSYNCKASYSSHFVGLLAKIAKDYGISIGEKIEINELEHIAFYPDEIIVFHDGGQVFHYGINFKEAINVGL